MIPLTVILPPTYYLPGRPALQAALHSGQGAIYTTGKVSSPGLGVAASLALVVVLPNKEAPQFRHTSTANFDLFAVIPAISYGQICKLMSAKPLGTTSPAVVTGRIGPASWKLRVIAPAASLSSISPRLPSSLK